MFRSSGGRYCNPIHQSRMYECITIFLCQKRTNRASFQSWSERASSGPCFLCRIALDYIRAKYLSSSLRWHAESMQMRACLFYLCVVLSITSTPCSAVLEDPGRGFGSAPNVTWYKGLADGLAAARKLDKPVMILIWHTGCHACTKLKWSIAGDTMFWELSKRFVMINVRNEEEPEDDEKYTPDGDYHPRIFFGDSMGNIDYGAYNRNGEFSSLQWKYYYAEPYSVTLGMRDAMRRFKLR